LVGAGGVPSGQDHNHFASGTQEELMMHRRLRRGFVVAALFVVVGLAAVTRPTGVPAPTTEVFRSSIDAPSPVAPVTRANDGKFHGTTQSGGAFRLDADGTGVAVVHTFDCNPADGCSPAGGLTPGSDGMFYGINTTGGALEAGTAFRVNADGTGFEVLGAFECAPNGCGFGAGLTQGSDGKFYGTTSTGGAFEAGTVFRLNADGTGLEVLHTFDCNPPGGCNPAGGLTPGSDGKLYGITTNGGAFDGGMAFRLNADGTGFEVLHAFDCGADGCSPAAGLTQGSDGKLYGTAQGGGTSGQGTVFRLNADGTGFEVLHAFECGADGCGPAAGLTQGSDGKFYGTTVRGGGDDGAGTAFRFNPDGTGFEVLYTFDCGTAGCSPAAGLTQGSDGMFYGTAQGGGAFQGGTAFRLNADGTGFEVLHAFDCGTAIGCNPFSGLTPGSDGTFYGTTHQGDGDGGSVFRITVTAGVALTGAGTPKRPAW
jgi:uncharacterized repeat protein (TIGR03803 family)